MDLEIDQGSVQLSTPSSTFPWTLAQSTRARVTPKERARAKAKVRTTRRKDSQKAKAKAKEKSREPENNENSKSDRKCFVFCIIEHFASDCDHRVGTVNEVTKTAPVSTPVSVITEPGHSLSHVYNRNTSVRNGWILALTVDIHSCSHHMASDMKLMVDSGAAIHVCPSWYGFSSLSASAKQLSLKKCWWRRVASSGE